MGKRGDILPHPPKASLTEKQDVFPKGLGDSQFMGWQWAAPSLWRVSQQDSFWEYKQTLENNRQDQEGMKIICLFLIETCLQIGALL